MSTGKGLFEGKITDVIFGVTQAGKDYAEFYMDVDQQLSVEGPPTPIPTKSISLRVYLTDSAFAKGQSAERLVAAGYKGGDMTADQFVGNRVKITSDGGQYDHQIFCGRRPPENKPEVAKKVLAKFGDKFQAALAKGPKPAAPPAAPPKPEVEVTEFTDDDSPF